MDLRRAPAEVHVDQDLVRRLLEEQHPHLASESLSLEGEGWDNVTYRLGHDHAVRLPRRRVAVDLLLVEQRWLPVIAPRLPVAVPVPVAVGIPSDLFRWPWSVVPWIPGTTADLARLAEPEAARLAEFLTSLHRPAPEDAPTNPFRGIPLQERAAVVEERLSRLALTELARIWGQALDAPKANGRTWLHGDLHARNVVVRGGALAGIIDWGDMTAGDEATDLACVWTLFDAAEERHAVLTACGAPPDVRARAAGWAVNMASALVDSGEPRHVGMGRAIVHRLLESGDDLAP